MKYLIKVRCIQGEGAAVSVLYSTLEVEAPNEDEANKLGFSKARQRYPGSRDVRVMGVEPAIAAAPEPPAMPPFLKREPLTLKQGKRA